MTPHDNSSTRSNSGRQFDLNRSAEQARPVPRLVNLILHEALESGAQQVHLHAVTLAVSFFRAGEWIQVMQVPAEACGSLINRLRVMAGLDRIKGKTRQEGTVEVVAEGTPTPFRVITQFTDAGDEEMYLHLPSYDER